MPMLAATVCRPGRRSHRGRPGRRGNRSRFRVDVAGRSSPPSEEAASPVSAVSRSLVRRSRAASARASACTTSSSASASELGATGYGPTLDGAESVTAAGSSHWSAPGASGSCTENELITSVLPQRRRPAAPIVAPTCGNARPSDSEADGIGVTRHRSMAGSGDLLQPGEYSFRMWQSYRVRSIVALVAALLGAGVLAAPPASAGPTVCDYPACTPGIMPHQVLGAPCDNTSYYAFGVADGYVSFASEPGRLMFCGSPRRYQPRWFRSPPMAGVKDENAECPNYLNYVAQAPDGLFLICIAHDGIASWVRADT